MKDPEHLICTDRTIISIFINGRMEIRGDWVKRKRGSSPTSDNVRICNFDNYDQAKRIGVLLKELLDKDSNIK